GPRPDQRRVEATGRSPEMERSWLDGPMTESHRYILEQLERERLRAKQNLGNGQKEKVFKRSKRAGGVAPRWERRSNTGGGAGVQERGEGEQKRRGKGAPTKDEES